MAAKRCHAFAGPAIAVSSTKAVAVEQARNHIVAAHKCKRAYRLYDFRRRRTDRLGTWEIPFTSTCEQTG